MDQMNTHGTVWGLPTGSRASGGAGTTAGMGAGPRAQTAQTQARCARRGARTPRWMWVALALIPATSGLERGSLVPHLRLSDIISLLLFVAVVFYWRGRWRPMDRLGVAVLAYGLAYALTTTIHYLERPSLSGTSPLLAEASSALQYTLLYMLAFALACHDESVHSLLWTSLLVSTVVAIVAVIQYIDVSGVRQLLAGLTGRPEIATPAEWKVYRSTGLFPSWHALGMYLAINSVYGLVLARLREALGLSARIPLLLVGVLTVGLATALTLTPAILVVVGLAAISSVRLLMRVVMVGAAVVFVLLSQTALGSAVAQRMSAQGQEIYGYPAWLPQTIAYRMHIWETDYLSWIAKDPILGYGPRGGGDEALFAYTYPESMYIDALFRGGLTLLIPLVVMLMGAVLRFRSVGGLWPPAEAGLLGRAALVVTWVLIFGQLIHPYLSDVGGAPAYFLMIGAASAFGAESAQGNASGLEARVG